MIVRRKAALGMALFGSLGYTAGVTPEETEKATHKHYERSPAAENPGPSGELAPRLQSLGKHVFPVTCRSAKVQAFVNQGMNLAYGFNHAEAGRAFRESARLDPNCAMAYWGQALVLGPNINAAMTPEDEPKAYEAAQKALSLKGRASARERAYIEAVATRYSGKAEDRGARDKAYAEAMRDLTKRYPDDLDAATLFAEALMDLSPWSYWMPDGQPYPATKEAEAALQRALAKNPNHPGALHYWIHLMEAHHPDRAVAEADRLLTLVPGAGHMVHMPSHIYQRVGRFADARVSNEKAVLADEDYIVQCRAQGLYPMAYYPHNVHFLWFAATMEGRSRTAIESARKVASKVSDDALKELPLLAGFRVVPFYALARFGKWDEMLAEAAPPDNLFLNGVWHYARGLAFAGKGQLSDAEVELATLRKIAGDPALKFRLFSLNTGDAITALAPEMLAAELAAKRKDFERAISHAERALRLEGGLSYTEPSEYHYPPRHLLGAVLLEAGRPGEAETVYWDDLRSNPENGWALFGLGQALRAQGKDPSGVEARFKKAWANADVTLTGSRF
jgi:tetratricopeptide (TPR) repeat protein